MPPVVILPCPFCGKLPELNIQLPRVGWYHASAYIRCQGFGHEAHSRGSRLVAEWVGNDVPLKRYCTDEVGLQNAINDAARGWNTRSKT